MSARLRTVLVGAGRIAQDYVLALEQSRALQLVAIVDPEPAARARAAALALAPTYADLAKLRAAGESIDAAIVASPPGSHAEISIELLDAGCHVFCEKPLATSTEDAERMIVAAERAERTLMMATKFRFVEDVSIARRIVRHGELGAIAFYGNTFCAKVDMTNRWNSDPRIAGGGVLIDNGTHSIDLARYLVGKIARVSATFGPRVQPIDVEDSAVLMFESADRALGRIELSWSVDRPSEHFVEIHGARGTLQLGWKRSRYRTSGDWIEFGSGYDKRRAFSAQLDHFAAVARGESKAIITARDALASVRIVDAAYRAAEDGTWLSIDEVEDDT